MERYYQRVPKSESTSSTQKKIHNNEEHVPRTNGEPAPKKLCGEQNIENLPADHGVQLTQGEQNDYRTLLDASVKGIRFMLQQGWFFQEFVGWEWESSGRFPELLQLFSKFNDDVENALLKIEPEILDVTSPEIQKDLVNSVAVETTNAIIREVGDELFTVIIDQFFDVSDDEKMAVALRFVDKKGRVVDRFLGITDVSNSTALSHIAAFEAFFARHGLSISRLRGQGYDGTKYNQGFFDGLKAHILKENSSAYSVHCCAQELESVLVGVAHHQFPVYSLFRSVMKILDVFESLSVNQLREKRYSEILETLQHDLVLTGHGFNQEISLKRRSDTSWGSHYGALVNLVIMFSSVVDALDALTVEGLDSRQKANADTLLDSLLTFEFIFCLHLMRNVLGITYELSQALQRKDQDIVYVMTLAETSKKQLQRMRDSEWDSLLVEVSSFGDKNEISVPNMDDKWDAYRWPRRKNEDITNLQYYCVEFFYGVIDMQILELDNRFTESTTDLLLCITCLNPNNAFSSFNKEKLVQLAQFYPKDFSEGDLMELENQLGTYIIDMRSNIEFSGLNELGSLSEKMVETGLDILYPLIYKLLKLALIFPIATATVGRAFSAMKIVKNRLPKEVGNQWMNEMLVTYIEEDVLQGIDKEAIIQRFQHMKPRRGQL